jgi:hypothetical protein
MVAKETNIVIRRKGLTFAFSLLHDSQATVALGPRLRFCGLG